MWGYPKLGMLPVPRRRPTSASAPAAGPSGSNSMALQGSDKPQARTRNQHSAVRRPVTAVIHGVKALIYHHVAALDPVTAYPPPLEPIVHQGFVHSSSAASVTIQEGRPTIERMSSPYEAYLIVKCISYTPEKPRYSLSQCFVNWGMAKDQYHQEIAYLKAKNPNRKLEYYTEIFDGHEGVKTEERDDDAYMEVCFLRYANNTEEKDPKHKLGVVMQVKVSKGAPRDAADVSFEGWYDLVWTAFSIAKQKAEEFCNVYHENGKKKVSMTVYGNPEVWSFETKMWVPDPYNTVLYAWFDVVPLRKIPEHPPMTGLRMPSVQPKVPRTGEMSKVQESNKTASAPKGNVREQKDDTRGLANAQEYQRGFDELEAMFERDAPWLPLGKRRKAIW